MSGDTRELPRRPLGTTGVTVTELGFGAAPIGNLYRARPDDVAHAVIEAAWAEGVRYFDTAPHYGLGLSERRLGAALAGRPRDDYVISTKVGRLLEPNPAPTGSDLAHGGFDVPDDQVRVRDYSADGVLRSIDASLRRLGVDRIDIVLVHDPDDHVDQALTEAVPALVALREQGVVRAVGLGMNQWQAPLRAVRETDVDVIMVAGRWTLVDRTAAPLLDACAERGVSVLAAAPYNSGLLARPWPPDDAYFDYGPAPADVLAVARSWAGTCERHGTTLPHAAMAFPLRHPAVASVVTGLGAVDHVRAAADRIREPVPEGLWAAGR
ncbi:aldo/keto reductase [Saccharothrix luteola]|uniref:aldo/keto reductase n=1 Tax=Saccharothrix luteola TaxID=2893018 RepID=UPI001E5CEC90|nr:aldo/keto reductase [Saccharothrix luteola]MCC8247130.1 aldo/keto reductase [Saccharothrix luteola]MCC8249829.1 aldo/keto reductase [Saccharothrix luteola]